MFFALFFVFGVSYYLFSAYKPSFTAQVRGIRSSKDGSYLNSIPLPTGSKEVGRIVREGFSQLTVSSPKPSQEVQQFFRSVLISKGWKAKDSSEDLLSVAYTRDQEKIEVSVLSFDDAQGTVFSISYSN